MQQSERDLPKENGLPARGKGQEGKGCHLPPETQRAAMADAARSDARCSALHQHMQRSAVFPSKRHLPPLKTVNLSLQIGISPYLCRHEKDCITHYIYMHVALPVVP